MCIDTYYVYVHTNIINGKKYVGITKQPPHQRWGNDGRNYKSSCPHFWNAIQKYGWNSFEHTVVADGLTKQDACNLEINLIANLNTQARDYGYNTMAGGTAPSIPADVRAKMSKSMRGNKNGLGHPCSDEKKQKISEAQRGKKLTDEHRANISKAKRGRTHISPTTETRQKIADSHKKKPVFCHENATVYRSVQECARRLGLYATNVSKCCRGKIKSTGGYHLQYYTNNTIKA